MRFLKVAGAHPTDHGETRWEHEGNAVDGIRRVHRGWSSGTVISIIASQ